MEDLRPNRRKTERTLVSMLQDFFQTTTAGGIVLILASALALVIANIPFLYGIYDYALNNINFSIGFMSTQGYDAELDKSILLWINDGVMAIFFLLVGLEIKRELVEGELSSRERAVLPFLAAIGGVVVPALIYLFINKDSPETIHGWAIPAATDIAFALCVVGMLGSRVPMSVKILLMAIAVIDDLGAIVIIALFYGHGFHVEPLYGAAFALVILFTLNRRNVTSSAPYIIFGVFLWVAILQSGLHATLAGVITALFIPLQSKRERFHSPLKRLEHGLHPWVAFLVLPVFGFANAGVPFTGMGLDSFTHPVAMGIWAGLLLGKPLGIFTVIYLAVRFKLSPMPEGANYRHIFGMSILCAIGFTMSLFIGGLAFTDISLQADIRLGVLTGSVIAAVLGYMFLRYASNPTADQPNETFVNLMTQQVDFLFGKKDEKTDN
jgi:NhaA family Na+:H+ antiporter